MTTAHVIKVRASILKIPGAKIMAPGIISNGNAPSSSPRSRDIKLILATWLKIAAKIKVRLSLSRRLASWYATISLRFIKCTSTTTSGRREVGRS